MARRGENIRKRKDGRWEGRYIKSRTSEGKAQWGYVYGSAYTEVKQALTRKKAESGFYNLKKANLTFTELAECWLQSIKTGVKESTFAHYSYTLHKYLLPILGGSHISSLNEEMLEQAVQQIIRPSGNEHKALGYSSARECLSMLRRICKYAAHLHFIRPLQLCVNLPKPKHQTVTPLSMEEQRQLHSCLLQAPTPRKIGVLLGFELGLRIGEICGLQWGDFDLNRGTVQISRTVSRISCGDGHTKVVIQAPKTYTSYREIPLPEYLLTILKELRGDFDACTWFLSGNSEKPVEPRCYRKSVQSYLRHASIRVIKPHMLRHTFATTCLQAGCDIKTLSELLGHSNPNITLQRYVHSDQSRKRQELNRVFSQVSGVNKGWTSKE